MEAEFTFSDSASRDCLMTAASPAATRRAGCRRRGLVGGATVWQSGGSIRNEAHQEYKQGYKSPGEDEGRNADIDSAVDAYSVGHEAGDTDTENGGCRLDDAFYATYLQRLTLTSNLR